MLSQSMPAHQLLDCVRHTSPQKSMMVAAPVNKNPEVSFTPLLKQWHTCTHTLGLLTVSHTQVLHPTPAHTPTARASIGISVSVSRDTTDLALAGHASATTAHRSACLATPTRVSMVPHESVWRVPGRRPCTQRCTEATHALAAGLFCACCGHAEATGGGPSERAHVPSAIKPKTGFEASGRIARLYGIA